MDLKPVLLLLYLHYAVCANSIERLSLINGCLNLYSGAGGGAVGGGTALQAGRSLRQFQMVSLEFFIGIILPSTLCPCGRVSL